MIRCVMKPVQRSEQTMTPQDVPGRLEIAALFPWLEHLVPAQEPADLGPAAAPPSLRPAGDGDKVSAELPEAA
jgi:hypothetical protein